MLLRRSLSLCDLEWFHSLPHECTVSVCDVGLYASSIPSWCILPNLCCSNIENSLPFRHNKTCNCKRTFAVNYIFLNRANGMMEWFIHLYWYPNKQSIYTTGRMLNEQLYAQGSYASKYFCIYRSGVGVFWGYKVTVICSHTWGQILAKQFCC